MDMCFCCCCAHCSRNCLDCVAGEGATTSSTSTTTTTRINAAPPDRMKSSGRRGSGSRNGKSSSTLNKCHWHWMMMLLLIIFLFGVTVCLLSANTNEEENSVCGTAAGVTGDGGCGSCCRVTSIAALRHFVSEWSGCSMKYPLSSSHSYHQYGQLERRSRWRREEWEEEEKKEEEHLGRQSSRARANVRDWEEDENDSWGDGVPLEKQRRQCNLVQRILQLDSGIKSIQFLGSLLQRHPCTINHTKAGRSNASEWEGIIKSKPIRMDQEGRRISMFFLVQTVAGHSLPEVDQWILTNGNQNYPVQIVTSFRRSEKRQQRHRPRLRVATERGPPKGNPREMLNKSFVVKNQFTSQFPRMPRRPHELVDNEDNLEATRGDNPADADDGPATYPTGQHRNFHFLRKLQFFDEGEEEEEEELEVQADDDGGGLEYEEASDVTVRAEALDMESEGQEPIQIGSITRTKRIAKTIEGLEEDLLSQSGASKLNPVLLANPQRSPFNPYSNTSITLRGLERFLELVQQSSSSPLKRRAISPTFRSRHEDSQLFRLEQRLNGGGGGVGGRRNGSAKKCKPNGTSKTCRRRKGMRRKAQTNVDNVQFRSVAKNGSSRTEKLNLPASGNSRKSSGDKWKFILENFCAKSHLHGQLPKLIAKLEKQQRAAAGGTRLKTKSKGEANNNQDHGQLSANGDKNNNNKSRAKVDQDRRPLKDDDSAVVQEDGQDEAEEDEEEEDELSLARTTDSLRLEVIKEQILKKLGLKRAPNITNTWTAAESSPPPLPVDGRHNDTDNSSSRSSNGRRMVEKKTANFMFGIGPSGIQLPNNNSQFFIHDGHTRPMDQDLFLSKELILATLYRAQLDSVSHQQQSHDGSYANPTYGQATNRLFDDLHADDRRRRRKGRKRKRKPHDGWSVDGGDEEGKRGDDNDEEDSKRASEALKSHTRRYLEEEFGGAHEDDGDDDFDEEDAFEERSHRYQWENNQQDDGGQGEFNYGQSREIITFAERGKLLNGRQHLLEFKPVGDHQTPGGDFRIRSAVLWLKVEHLQQQQQTHQQQQQQQAQRDTENDAISGGGGRNITIWIFNMKTSGPWESKSDDCAVNYGTQNEEKVVSNCPSSELPREDATKTTTTTANGEDARDANQELNLNEKDFNRVSELTLTHTIHLPNSPAYDDQNGEDSRGTSSSSNRDRNHDHQASLLSSNGWHRFDITTVARRWNNINRASTTGQRPINLQLLVDCSGCRRAGVHVHLFHGNKLWNGGGGGGGTKQQQQQAPPPLMNENRPFLVAHTEPNTMKRVRRRAVDCSGAQNGRCCKQRFYVSFKAIGWDDWIIFPHGYFANYCRGSCAYRTPDMLPTKYSQFMGEFRRLGKMAEMQPCCAPLKFSSMDLIYYDHDRKIIKSNLPQMIVDECGCP